MIRATNATAPRQPPGHGDQHERTNPSRGTKFALGAMKQLVALLLLTLALALTLASATNQKQHISSSSVDEVKLAYDKPAAGAARVDANLWEPSTSGRTDQPSVSSREMESLLVRQLSDLIMNNEPIAIRRKLESERIEGQLTAETNRLLVRQGVPLFKLRSESSTTADGSLDLYAEFGAESTQEDDNDREPSKVSAKKRRDMATAAAAAAPHDGPGSDLSSAAAAAAANGNNSGDPAGTKAVEQFLQEQENQALQQFDEQHDQQTVTCSPDYEDQTIMVDHDSAQMNELLASGGGGSLSATGGSSNLTAEQRQQLLSGTDISGLLMSNQTGVPPPHLHQQVSIGQCVPAGSRMIEVITKVITPILFTIIIIVGLLGNIIVMLVILEDRQVERELTPTNLLILDLSLADLSFIVLCIPFTGWDYAVGHWVFGSLWCKCNQYLIVVCALSSIYTLVLMSCDRFMAIVYPIECISYRTSKNMLHAIVIKWIVILVVASPTIFMHGLVDSPLAPDQYNCRFLSDQFNPLHFQFIFFITSYFLPLVLIFFLYLSLLRRLWCGQKPHGHKESTKMLESKKRVTWLVASIVLVFAACWFPIQIMLILMRLKTHKITATYVAVQVFAHTLGYMNSCVNPIVYAFASDTFNQSFKKSRLGRACLMYLCCQPRSSSANNHHQHRHSLSTTNGHHLHNPHQQTMASQQQQQQHYTASTTTGRSNKSMGDIFAQPMPRLGNLQASARLEDGYDGSQSGQQQASLALQPRDRAPLVVQQRLIAPSSSAIQIDSAAANRMPQQSVPKQQLVASMVFQGQSGSSGAPVHRFFDDSGQATKEEDDAGRV